jgi:CHC2 zinc finger
MNLESILDRFQGVRRSGAGWTAQCPAHEDHRPSLSIKEGDGKILFHCHGGCSFEAICAALKIEPRELSLQNGDGGPKKPKRKIVATYNYTDEKGTLRYQKLRYEPKGFVQRQPGDSGGWIAEPYCLVLTLAAIRSETKLEIEVTNPHGRTIRSNGTFYPHSVYPCTNPSR